MTWLSRIFFSATLAAHAVAATVSGEVRIVNSRDQNVRNKSDYSGVVVWLERVGAPQPESAPRTVKIVQKQKRFLPHLVAVPVGSTVDFPNLDLIFHNAFSNFAGQPFDVGLYAPRTSKSVTFKKAGIVRVFCNIHSTMSATIAVLGTPWYAVTQYSGKYNIANVPPGEYQLRIFHERALPENLKFLERRIAVPESGLTLPLVSISETGFIPAPHRE